MQKSALAFLFCLISTIANAQVQINKPVYCDNATRVLQIIKDQYQERLIWIGSQSSGIIMLTVNEITQSWTLLETYDEIACILGTGNKYSLIHKPTPTL